MVFAVLLAAALPCSSASTQLALDRCWSSRATAAGAQLRVAQAQAAAAARSGAQRVRIAATQTAWNSAMTATCALDGTIYASGTIAPMMESECADTLTRERTARLNALASALRSTGHAPHAVPESQAAHAQALRFDDLYLQHVESIPAARTAFLASQRSWSSYVRVACALEGGACLTELDRERVADLKATWLGETFW